MIAKHEEIYKHLVIFAETEGTEVGEEISKLLEAVRTLEYVPSFDTYFNESINEIIEQILTYCKEWVLYCLIDCNDDCDLSKDEIFYWKSLI